MEDNELKYGGWVLKFKKILDSSINIGLISLMVLIVVTVFIQVFSRYVLNTPLTWSEELARYLFVWIVFIASAVVFRENKHMSVDFIVTLFPEKIQRMTTVFVDLIITVFLIILLYNSPSIIKITMRQTSPTLSIPMGVIYLAFPVALGLMLFELIMRVVRKVLVHFSLRSEEGK